MAEMDKKLSRFISAMLDDARTESLNITQEVSSRRNAYMTNAENEILAEVYNYIRSEVTKAKNRSGRLISTKILENKRKLFNERALITDEVMKQVKELVASYVTSPEYTTALCEMVSQATQRLSTDDVVIFLRKEDMCHINAIKAGIPQESSPSQYLSGDFILGGIQAESRTKRLHMDLTFDSSFETAKNKFADITKQSGQSDSEGGVSL